MATKLLAAMLAALAIAAGAQRPPSLMPPGGLAPAATPQFVLLTHDDSIPSSSHAMLKSLTAGKRTASGCPLVGTLFVCTQCYARNNCGAVRDLWASGFEVADHSINHQQMLDWSLEQVREEILGGRAAVAACGIPPASIVGWRTPYLKANPAMRTVLHNNGFLYDSSLVEDTTGKSVSRGPGARIWPWAMGYGIPINCDEFHGFQHCGQGESYPGLWQVPLWQLDAPGTSWMDYGKGADEPAFDILKRNFDATYAGNRAPFPIFVHSPYLSDNLGDVQRFIDYAAAKPNTYFVTMRQMLAWMTNPVPIGQLTPSRLGCGIPGGAPGGAGISAASKPRPSPNPPPPPPAPRPRPPPPAPRPPPPSPRPPAPRPPRPLPMSTPKYPRPATPTTVPRLPARPQQQPGRQLPAPSRAPVPAPVPVPASTEPQPPAAPQGNATASPLPPLLPSPKPPPPVSPQPDVAPPMPASGVRITLTLSGVDAAAFRRATEQQLLLVLVREVAADGGSTFVASLAPLPGGSASGPFADALLAAAANRTAVPLSRRRALLAAAHSANSAVLPTAPGSGSPSTQAWLLATVVAGGPGPLRMFNATLQALRDGTVSQVLALSHARLATPSIVVPFQNGADLPVPAPTAQPTPAPAATSPPRQPPALGPPLPAAPFPAPLLAPPSPAASPPLATAPAPGPQETDTGTDLDGTGSAGGIPAGAIAGGAVGALLALAAAAVLFLWAFRRRRSNAAVAHAPGKGGGTGGAPPDEGGSSRSSAPAASPASSFAEPKPPGFAAGLGSAERAEPPVEEAAAVAAKCEAQSGLGASAQEEVPLPQVQPRAPLSPAPPRPAGKGRRPSWRP